jgi:CelD/BcsL family acetyltransferase involved in cellulose biosynthesis
MQAFVSGLRERGIVTALVRIHPLLRPPAGVLEQIGQVVDHGRSVSIDLTLSVEALWQQTRENHRRDIQRAARWGYVVRIDETWASLGTFVAIYQQTMDRLHAADFWRLSRDYFEELRAALAGHIHLCVAEIEGEVAAAALLIEEDGLVEYHLAGTADSHVSMSPSKSIVDFASRWAKARGNHTLHLAGSLRTGDSLNHFKVGFSPRQHPVETWRIVADPDAYARLQARWARTRVTDLPQPDGYFPAYRQP